MLVPADAPSRRPPRSSATSTPHPVFVDCPSPTRSASTIVEPLARPRPSARSPVCGHHVRCASSPASRGRRRCDRAPSPATSPVIEDAAHTLPDPARRRAVVGAGRRRHLLLVLREQVHHDRRRRDGRHRRRSLRRAHAPDVAARHRRRTRGSATPPTARWYYEIVAPGFKYNLTDIAAALGLVQLAKLDAMWHRRVEIAQSATMRYSGGM